MKEILTHLKEAYKLILELSEELTVKQCIEIKAHVDVIGQLVLPLGNEEVEDTGIEIFKDPPGSSQFDGSPLLNSDTFSMAGDSTPYDMFNKSSVTGRSDKP